MRTVPKIFLGTAGAVAIAFLIQLPIEAFIVLGLIVFGFLLDVLFDQNGRHQEALLWFTDHVQLTDKPIAESDAPESLKKLMKREEDIRNS